MQLLAVLFLQQDSKSMTTVLQMNISLMMMAKAFYELTI
jgi:hypothetical protein